MAEQRASDYLASACKHFETPVGAVAKSRIEGDEFVLLWDRGVNGIAKDRVPLSKLSKKRAATPKAKAAPPKTDK